MKKLLKFFYHLIYKRLFPKSYKTRGTSSHLSIRGFFIQKIVGVNRGAYWPVHFTSRVSCPQNILIGVGSSAGISPGCYIQGIGKIYIGDYSIVAPNVGIISANHDIYNHKLHIKGEVRIGNYCWIGMNSVILPNVTLGDFTIVAAGSVVRDSFEGGHCILSGNPAKIVKTLDRNKCVRHKDKYEYIGYYKKNEFEKFRKKYLNV